MIAIACMEQHTRGIGYQNKLLFHIKEDMKFFKEETNGKIVVMGRKTFESLGSKPLPNRANIVITNTPEKYSDHDNVIFRRLDMFLIWLNALSNTDNIYVIGGAQLYKELLPYCNKILLTEVDKEDVVADTFFPELFGINGTAYMCNQGSINEDPDTGLRYSFNTYFNSLQSKELKYCNVISPKDHFIL